MNLNKRAIKMISNKKNLKLISSEAIDLAVSHAGKGAEISYVLEIFKDTFDHYAVDLLAANLFMVDLNAYCRSQGIYDLDTRKLQRLITQLDMDKTVSVKEVLLNLR